MYIIETPGERLYNLRKKYKITQNQVAGEYFTRALISSIELGKSKLMKETASKIVINLNKILISKGANEKIPLKYLLEDKDKQTEVIIEKFIGDIKDISLKNNYADDMNRAIGDIEEFILTYKIASDKICIIYEAISNIYTRLYEYEKAKLYMNKCISFAGFDNDQLIKYYHELIKVNYRLNDFKEIIYLFETIKIIIYRNDFSDKIESKYIYVNASLAYGYLNLYKEALDCIIGLENAFDDDVNISVKMQKANCLMELKNLELAEKEFNMLLDISLAKQLSNVRSLTYINLAYIEVYRGNFAKAKDYCYIAKEIKVENLNEVAKNYCLLIDIFIKIDDVESIENLYKDAIKSNIDINNKGKVKEIISMISSYLGKNEHMDMLDNFIKFLYKNNKELHFDGMSDAFVIAMDNSIGNKNRVKEYIRMAAKIARYNMGIKDII